jgi:hypothetical protein
MLGLNDARGLSFNVHIVLQPAAVLALGAGCILSIVLFPAWLPRIVRPIWPAADALWTFGLLFLIMVSIAVGTYSPFLYFRF